MYKRQVLRYWEEQFPTLKPIKRSGGRRYYRPEDVALLVQIDRLVHQEGYKLSGARLAIENGGDEKVAASPVAAAPDTAPQLRAIRNALAAALASG